VLELGLFDEVGEVVRGLLPPALRPGLQCRAQRYGVKVWFEAAADVAGKPAKAHYEAQVISKKGVVGAKVLGLEIGFHAEYPDAARNDSLLARLTAAKAERTWREALGPEAVAGPFLGRADTWRRVSETWADPDLSDPELAMEVGARLTDYICALEPHLR